MSLNDRKFIFPEDIFLSPYGTAGEFYKDIAVCNTRGLTKEERIKKAIMPHG